MKRTLTPNIKAKPFEDQELRLSDAVNPFLESFGSEKSSDKQSCEKIMLNFQPQLNGSNQILKQNDVRLSPKKPLHESAPRVFEDIKDCINCLRNGIHAVKYHYSNQ